MTHSWLKPPPQSFSAWLKDNPEPDLLALAKHYGGLGNVPEAVMQTFEAARADWQLKMRSRHLNLETSEPNSEPIYHDESEPGADIPPEILKKIEAKMRQRGIMRRPCLKKKETP
jgi:hypothetical protein